MIADESQPINSLGKPDAGVLELRAFCQEIVSFIGRELTVWRERPELSKVENEPRLNQSLCLHLDKASRHNFDSIRFLQEPIQGSGRNADIGALPVNAITVEGITYQDFEQLLPIECKRLPTPSGSHRSDLEYVHGLPGQRTGGIERFKHGLHGRDNRHALMIAYVQTESFTHWHKLINERLAKLAHDGHDSGAWSPVETLVSSASVSNSDVRRYTSRHSRCRPPCCSECVEMEHLWLTLN